MTDRSMIIQLVAKANPDRNRANLSRRVHKIFEELGEIEEAYLNVTSSTNGKGKTFADVREEACDVLIVAIDVALTPLTDDDDPAVVQQSLVSKMSAMIDDKDYDVIIWRIARYASNVGRCHKTDICLACAEGWHLVLYAFELVELVFRRVLLEPSGETVEDATDQIVPEIKRKLAKWIKNRQDKVTVTDAE